jgi:L-malate glycosyltransferase
MKILYVSDAQSIHTRRWAEAYRDIGNEIHIASFRPNEIPGVQVHCIDALKLGKVGYLFSIPRLRRLFKMIRPDIVHAHYITSYGFIAAIAGLHPLIITAWGSDILVTPKKSIIMKLITRYALLKADFVTTVAEHMNHEVVSLGVSIKKCMAITMGIDFNKFTLHNKRQFHSPSSYRILSTRRFESICDVGTLISAIGMMSEKGFKIHVDLVGSGKQEAALKLKVSKLGLQEIFTFHGIVTLDRLLSLLAQDDIFVSTSLSDGNNISLNEAMAMGCYPVATNIPANSQWINHGENGLLYSPGDPFSLFCMLRQIYGGIAFDEIASKNRELIERKANWVHCIDTMNGLYHSLGRNIHA